MKNNNWVSGERPMGEGEATPVWTHPVFQVPPVAEGVHCLILTDLVDGGGAVISSIGGPL